MKKFALVEWTNEADAGSYSVVSSEWILGYTPEMYLIEWREGQGRKKPPSGGWPMGEAKVLQTSDKEAELKKVLHEMTTIKGQGHLLVTGKRKRIPKKRLYESDDETDTDACRSSGDEKKRLRGKKKPDESDVSSSPLSQGRSGLKATTTPSFAQQHNDRGDDHQALVDKEDDADGGQEGAEMSQDMYPEMSSERDLEDSTDDMLAEGDADHDHMTGLDHLGNHDDEDEEEGSEPEYPPEYELSELEKLRLEVRGLRDEILLLRHQVCKELPKVHAIALKALGTHNSLMLSNHPPTEDTTRGNARMGHAKHSAPAVNKKRVVVKQQPKKRVICNPTALKKEAEVFRKKVQMEKAMGKPTAVLTPTRAIKSDRGSSPSASPIKRHSSAQNSNQIELHPGTGVFLDREAWESLSDVTMPTQFARRLLPLVFSLDTLLNSNLRGGKSTRDVGAEPKMALDQNKVDAIYKAVITKFPEISYCDIGQAINGRLSSIRYREQKRQARIALQK